MKDTNRAGGETSKGSNDPVRDESKNEPSKSEAVRMLIEAMGDARAVLEVVGEDDDAGGRLAQRLANRLKLTQEMFTEELDAREGLYKHIEGSIRMACGFLFRLADRAEENEDGTDLWSMPALNLSDAWDESLPFWKNKPRIDDKEQP